MTILALLLAGGAEAVNLDANSIFVPGVPPKPAIIKDYPTDTNIQTIGGQPVAFQAHSDQTVNITWYLDGNLVLYNGSMGAGVIANYIYTPTATGSHYVNVTATNNTTGFNNTTYWNWNVRSKTYFKGNRIWDGSKPNEYALTYTWDPMSFYAFYYDMDSGVGTESLTMNLDSYTDRSIQEHDLKYSTSPQEVNFQFSKWGTYNGIGFMADKYFAGYTDNSTGITDKAISTMGSKQLHKILTDDDTTRTVYAGSTLTLSEGYVVKIKDVNIGAGSSAVWLSLLKDSSEVFDDVKGEGETFVYAPKNVGNVNDLPIIAVHIDKIFRGKEATAAFTDGIFQISESYTAVNTGNRYGIMEITDVSDTGMKMDNKNNLSLSAGSTNHVMGNLKIIVADNSSVVRFAPMVQKSGIYEVRGTIAQNSDTNFQWTPMNFEGFYYNIDDDVGTENINLTRNGRSIRERKLIYTTTPQPVSFKYSNWGTYNVIGFMAEKYFAGYTDNSKVITDKAISTISSKHLHKVLIDDDIQRLIYAGSTLTLSEGYVIKIKDVNIGAGSSSVWLSLLKDGSEIFDDVKSEGETFIYAPKKIGNVSDLPIIALRIDRIFRGKEATAAFTKGTFQISEKYTTVNTGDDFGVMEVTEVSDAKIRMENPSSINLSSASTVDMMGNIKFKVADSSDVRFYPFVEVKAIIVSERGDINRNGKRDTGDATLILRSIVGLPIPEEYMPILPASDMNCNGRIDTGDATLVLRDVVGLPIPRCWDP